MWQVDTSLARLLPFASHVREVSGGWMHFVDEGQGAPLLLVHGNPTWSYLYRDIVGPLAARHRVVVPDHLGFGLSERPAGASYALPWHIANLRDLVLGLDLHDLTLVLHDWGGPIGLGAALELGDRVRRLVLMNTWAWRLPSGAPIAPILAAIREPERGERLVLEHNFLVEQGIPGGIYHRDRVTQSLLEAYRRPTADAESRRAILTLVRSIPVGAAGAAAETMAGIERGLASLHLPTLLIWGQRDPVFPPATVTVWQRLLPQATVAWLAEASHFLQEDAPQEIATLLLDWVAAQAGRDGD
ncbi:MAG: alpha/beta fold hydrolase [Myxococcota bacterium]